MKTVKHFTALLLMALAGSCDMMPLPALAFGHRAPPPEYTVTPEPTPSPSPYVRGQLTALTVGKISGATPDEVEMIIAGKALANAALAGDCFKAWVLAAHYTENNGMSQAEILDLVESSPVQVDVEMYTGGYKANYVWKTVGYENEPYDGIVHMNRHFVKSAFMVADNLIHEAEGHSQGFHHYGVKSTSQPYGMNYAFEGCHHAQLMQAKGGKPYQPPGLRLEHRHSSKKAARPPLPRRKPWRPHNVAW